MKGGHGDSYYYQLVASIRRYKGARPAPADESRPIQVDGRFDDWTGVRPEFRDTIGDPVHRDHAGWGKNLHYRNTTGRNDIVAAKVSFDRDNAYFYVRTREKLSSDTDTNWMLLFINSDHNPKTGWLGYDLVVNRRRSGGGKTLIENNVAGNYAWIPVGEVPFARGSSELEMVVPLSTPGMSRSVAELDFKWADNIQQTGDWSDFTLNGDVAPDDRFNYRAVVSGH